MKILCCWSIESYGCLFYLLFFGFFLLHLPDSSLSLFPPIIFFWLCLLKISTLHVHILWVDFYAWKPLRTVILPFPVLLFLHLCPTLFFPFSRFLFILLLYWPPICGAVVLTSYLWLYFLSLIVLVDDLPLNWALRVVILLPKTLAAKLRSIYGVSLYVFCFWFFYLLLWFQIVLINKNLKFCRSSPCWLRIST